MTFKLGFQILQKAVLLENGYSEAVFEAGTLTTEYRALT
jgi:hypothetical protein